MYVPLADINTNTIIIQRFIFDCSILAHDYRISFFFSESAIVGELLNSITLRKCWSQNNTILGISVCGFTELNARV